MSPLKLRRSARAVIIDESNRVLLCRFAIPDPAGTVVWAAPGGGIEPGETLLAALRRELLEETGLEVDGEPPHVWTRRVVDPGHAKGYDGVLNEFFLIRTTSFQPRGAMSDEELAGEGVTGFRWWTVQEIAGYQGPALFAPRDLAAHLAALVAGHLPASPVPLGL